MKTILLSTIFISLLSSVNAEYLTVGQRVDVDMNIFSDKDLGMLSRGIKEDCIFLGKEDGMYVFQYDGEKMIFPLTSIKRIILKN